MESNSNTLSKYTVSFGLSLAAASVFNALLVVVKEKSPAVASGMQRLTGHHWVTHGAMVVLLFVVGGFLFSRLNSARGPAISARRLTQVVGLAVAAGWLIITGFYLIAD